LIVISQDAKQGTVFNRFGGAKVGNKSRWLFSEKINQDG
jgi:hypothetical protein